jgi:hypothetical protein
MRLDPRVTLVGSLPTDLSDHSLDRFKRNVQVGQFGQIARRLLIGNTVDASMDHFFCCTRGLKPQWSVPNA